MQSDSKDLLFSNCELLKAMAHPARLCILKQLAEMPKSSVGELNCCEWASQSSVSQHLAKLREMGLVTYQREGNILYYSVSNDKVKEVVKVFYP